VRGIWDDIEGRDAEPPEMRSPGCAIREALVVAPGGQPDDGSTRFTEIDRRRIRAAGMDLDA
jgi:hypothetical protein